jgi:ribosomal protein L30/L7E
LASGETKDVVVLNVKGTVMATKRATLQIAEESVLAQQFDDTKWTVQGSFPPVKAWTPGEVTNWVKSIEGIPEDVASLFGENEIKGSELLALDKEGLKMLGVKRVGTICLLFDEISTLKKAANDDEVTQIEHSPYCFGKILDYLRLKQLHSVNLVKDPALPTVRKSQQKTFEKIVDYYFPGDSSKFILG